jgi:hypothetical protein
MFDMRYLRELYIFDEQTRTFVIPVSVARFANLFNPLDPSPSHKRDLSLDLADYLRQCSDEIPLKYAAALMLTIAGDAPDARQEQSCADGIRNFYRREAALVLSEIQRRRRGSLKYVLISFSSLSLSIFMRDWRGLNLFADYAIEALIIGAWIFLWQAVSVNFIEMEAFWDTHRKYKRLTEAKVSFEYV